MQEKPAAADVPIHDLIARRWSPRAFDPRPVSESDLASVFEAARWAPSCFNEQPWRFLLAARADEEGWERLFSCLAEGNQSWAITAPVLFAGIARLQFTRNGKPNRWAQHDLGLASENLAIQATALGLSVHFMAGFDAEALRKRSAIPEEYEAVYMACLGYGGNPEDLPEELAEREVEPRVRRPVEEFVFGTQWGDPAGVAED